MFKNRFIERIRELRDEKNLTQKQVANQIGITERTYQYFESEKSFHMPTVNSLIGLANLFEVSIDYLLCCTDNPVRNK